MIDGLSSWTTVWLRRRSPRLAMVFRWSRAKPIVLFFQVIAIFANVPYRFVSHAHVLRTR